MVEQRKLLASGAEPYAEYRLQPDEAVSDPLIRSELGPQGPQGLALAQEVGWAPYFDVLQWHPTEASVHWRVSVPPDLEDKIAAIVWDFDGHPIEKTATRSTRHGGWQLTVWTQRGEPWGHTDHDSLADLLAEVEDRGTPIGRLKQVTFTDGRVLVREGASAMRNPMKRRLMH